MPLLDSTVFTLILWALVGYGLGSVPWGMILARVMGLGDLRNIGSGNIGATNVMRTGNKVAAAMTLTHAPLVSCNSGNSPNSGR